MLGAKSLNSAKNSKDKQRKNKPFYNFCYDFVKITGAIPVMLTLRPKIYRPYGTKTPKGAVMVSANHRSFIDPIIVHLAFPGRRLDCLATKELYKNKVLTFFFNKMHCIMVDKENFSVSAFRDVTDRLSAGKMVVIFPEGKVNTENDDEILVFKSGAVLMAHRGKAPILPIYIVKRDKWYQRQRIVIGKPFDVCAEMGRIPTIDQLNAASEALRKMEIELREYFESLPVYKRLAKHHKTNNELKVQTESEKERETKDEQKV